MDMFGCLKRLRFDSTYLPFYLVFTLTPKQNFRMDMFVCEVLQLPFRLCWLRSPPPHLVGWAFEYVSVFHYLFNSRGLPGPYPKRS